MKKNESTPPGTITCYTDRMGKHLSNLFNFHPFVSSRARGLNLGLSPYFVNASGEASGESEPPMLENAINAKITYEPLHVISNNVAF